MEQVSTGGTIVSTGGTQFLLVEQVSTVSTGGTVSTVSTGRTSFYR